MKTRSLADDVLMAAESLTEVADDPNFVDLSNEGMFDESDATSNKSVWD